jgi:adenylyltransferase/sulfurtransferase
MSGQKIEIKTEGYGETAFDRAKLISWWSQDVVSASKVLVIGAGAIGNETLKNLALLGVGSMFICDMDTVSTSNLSRTVLFGKDDVGKYKAQLAAERVKQMSNNPNCKVDYFIGDIVNKLGHGVFRRFDVVLGCLDNMLIRSNVNRRCCLFEKPYMDAGISELGLSLNVHHYPESSCLECGMDAKDIARERMVRYSCDVFKKRAVQEGHAATVLISTAIVSALQVQETIKALHQMNGLELELPIQYGQKYYYQGMNHLFLQMKVPLKEDCSAHFNFGDVIETTLSAKDSLRSVLNALGELLDYECVIDTYPDSSFVLTAPCKRCQKNVILNKPKSEIYTDEVHCLECEPVGDGEHVLNCHEIDMFGNDSMLLDYTLEQLGIPLLHVLTVRAKEDESKVKYVELTGDLNAVLPNTFGDQ